MTRAGGGARGALMDRLINRNDAVRSEATIQSDVRMVLLDLPSFFVKGGRLKTCVIGNLAAAEVLSAVRNSGEARHYRVSMTRWAMSTSLVLVSWDSALSIANARTSSTWNRSMMMPLA